jgi:hypothetical protein
VDSDTQIAIDVELGNFVSVTDDVLGQLEETWQAWMDLPKRPRPHTADAYWVLQAGDLEESDPVDDQHTSWRTLSTRLAKFPKLKDAYFFRVAGIQPRRATGTDQFLEPENDVVPLSYALTTRTEYALKLDAYSEARASFPDVLEPKTSELLTATEPVTSTIGQATSLQIFLRTGAVQAAETAILVLRGKTGDEDRAPRVALAVRVKPRYLLVAGLLVLVAVGVAVAGLNWKDVGASGELTVALKIAGALLVSVSLFVASRSAPGVSK